MTSVRLLRLQSDYEAVRWLTRQHPNVGIEGVSGNPPEVYRLTLSVRSLRQSGNGLTYADSHRLEVRLPHGYPRDAPVCRMLTPVFHPNIAPHAVCIGDHWTAAESLDRLIMRVCEMLAFQSYNTKSPLNGQAAQWVDTHAAELPIDRMSFFLDLEAAPEPEAAQGESRCANCGEVSDTLEAVCAEGHGLCADCLVECSVCKSARTCMVCSSDVCAGCAAARSADAAQP